MHVLVDVKQHLRNTARQASTPDTVNLDAPFISRDIARMNV